MSEVLPDNAVEIELGGDTFRLVPTLAAAQSVSRQFKGFPAAVDAVMSLQHDAIVGVVRAGLKKPPKDIEERVFRTGYMAVASQLIEFITILSNGGRKREEDADEEGDSGNE